MNKKNPIKKRIITTIITVILCFNSVLYIMPSSVYAADSNVTVIDVTGDSIGADVNHRHITERKYDSQYHWDECFKCGKKFNITAHSMVESGVNFCSNAYGTPKMVCSGGCGYSYNLTKMAHNPSEWVPCNDRPSHYKYCLNSGCGNWTTSGRCVDEYGRELGCHTGISGTCAICGRYWDATKHSYAENYINGSGWKPGTTNVGSDGYSGTIYCNCCGETFAYFTLTQYDNYSQENVTEYTYRITPVSGFEITSTPSSGTCSAMIAGHRPTWSCNSWWEDGTYVIHSKVVYNESCDVATVDFHTSFNYRYTAPNGIQTNQWVHLRGICNSKADNIAPRVTNLSAAGNGSVSNFSLKAEINVTLQDWVSANNVVSVRLIDKDKVTPLTGWHDCVLNGSNLYSSIFDIVAEVREQSYLYVQFKDRTGNTSKIENGAVLVQYIDTLAPRLQTSTSTAKTWSQYKTVEYKVKDEGIGNVQIAFNENSNYGATVKNGDYYSRTYKFVGDVSHERQAALYMKDALGNDRMVRIGIWYIDSTAPTFTTSLTNNHINTTVKITADDYCKKADEQGSGKVADGAGKYGFYYGISTKNDINTVTWTALQTSSTYTYTLDYNTYYIWVKDYAGNISDVKSIKTNPYWNVTYNSNNPNSIENIISIPSTQKKWAQSNLTLSTYVPKKIGYVFLYWNTKADGSGTSYKPGETYSINADLALYAQWRPDEYKVYYDKGLSSDTSTEIANATRNTNIQKTDTERPYTQAYYDKDVSFATPGSLKGRKYTLTFNTNIPASITKQKNNRTAVPTTVNTVTGNLPSQNKWQITGQDGTVTTNLTPTMGSTVNSPNYVSADNASVTATALWNNKILNGYGTPTLTGWKFVGWYDNQSGAKSTAVSNTTDMIRVVNTTTNMSANTNVKVTGNVTSYTVQPKTTDFNQTLYARWQRTITLTFNMNGGKYYYTDNSGNKQATNGVVLTGIYYNNADGYEFSLDETLTSASLPNYEKQLNKIDAYGTYNDNGENSKYSKYLSDDTRYRFLGWSTNPNATVPDSELITYDNNHKTKYRIYDDTVLYAVWEPVLTVYVSLNNTNGNKNFSDGSSPVLSGQAVAADGTQYLSIIAYPGETVEYNVVSLGRADRELYVGFDNKITDIYENYGSWTDGYNPSTSEDTYSDQHQGLNRHISPASKYIKRSFVVPMYLGTEFSYSTSIGVGKYYIVHEMMQNSYYFKYCKGEDEEKVRFVTVLYITNNKNYNGPDDPGPDVPIIPANPDNPIHSPAEIKTTIEFEYNN